MTASEIAAYIGAGAWLPQIARWIYALAKRPKLKLVSAGTAQVCYNGFGPIVTLTTAISCERRDALIKTVKLKATHEKGEQRRLTWFWLNEPQLQVSAPTGELVEFRKNQPALGLKVSTGSLTEKQITFNDPEFSVGFSRVTQAVLRRYDHLSKNMSNAEDSLFKSTEFIDAQEFFAKGLYWKEGGYNFEVELEVVGLSSPHRGHFRVMFRKADINILQTNLTLFESYIRTLIQSQSALHVQWPQWKWANPEIAPIGYARRPLS